MAIPLYEQMIRDAKSREEVCSLLRSLADQIVSGEAISADITISDKPVRYSGNLQYRYFQLLYGGTNMPRNLVGPEIDNEQAKAAELLADLSKMLRSGYTDSASISISKSTQSSGITTRFIVEIVIPYEISEQEQGKYSNSERKPRDVSSVQEDLKYLKLVAPKKKRIIVFEEDDNGREKE